MADPLLSVVVCSYNRARLLLLTLEYLAKLTQPTGGAEIIVVDNNSKDDTADRAGAFCADRPGFRYVFEGEQGLSAARNRGVAEARGAYVGFLDDETQLEADWLLVAAEIAEQLHPDIFGGPYDPWYEDPKPDWFKDAYGGERAWHETDWLPEGRYVSGGNMFVRRGLFDQIGLFRTNLGMTGGVLRYGEESELIDRARRMAQATVYYDHRLLIRHLVRPEKFSLRWRARQCWRMGAARADFADPGARRGVTAALCLAQVGFKFARQSATASLFRNRKRYPAYANFLYEKALPRLEEMAMLWGSIRPRGGAPDRQGRIG